MTSSYGKTRQLLIRVIGVCYVFAFLSVYYSSADSSSIVQPPALPSFLHDNSGKTNNYLTHDILATVALVGGALAAFMVVTGYGATSVMIGVLQLLYLCVNTPDNTPDRLLIECGFLLMFLAPTLPTTASSPPSVWLLLLIRWFGIRVLFTTGLVWLRQTGHDDCIHHGFSCYDFYYETQPNPTRLAYVLHRYLPHWVHQVQLVYALVCQLIVPFGWLVPYRAVRITTAYQSIMYQLGILLTGGHAFMPLVLMIPAVAALDDDSTFVTWFFPSNDSEKSSYFDAEVGGGGGEAQSLLPSPQHQPLLSQRQHHRDDEDDSLVYSDDNNNGDDDDDDDNHDHTIVAKVAIDDTGRSSVYISSIFDLLSSVADDHHPHSTSSPPSPPPPPPPEPPSYDHHHHHHHDPQAVIEAAAAARGDRQLGVMFTEVDDDTLSIDSLILKPRRRAAPSSHQHTTTNVRRRGWLERWMLAQAKRLHPLLQWHASCLHSSFKYRHRVAYTLRFITQCALVAFVATFSIIHAGDIINDPARVTTGPLYAFNTYGAVYTFHHAAYRVAIQFKHGDDGEWHEHLIDGNSGPVGVFSLPLHHVWLERQALLQPYEPAPQWLIDYMASSSLRPQQQQQQQRRRQAQALKGNQQKGVVWARAQLYRIRFNDDDAGKSYSRELVRASYVIEKCLPLSPEKTLREKPTK